MYDVFIVDPPWNKRWEKYGKNDLRKVRPIYEVMSVQEIFNLLDEEVFTTANIPHTVFMWTIEEFLESCDQEMKRRNYRRHIRLIWDKCNGFPAAFTVRFSHEYLIWYYKPKMLCIQKSMRGKFTSIIREKKREHSRKPDSAYDLIKCLYPKQNKIDVFSREKREGFAQWGNEIDHYPIQEDKCGNRY